MIALGGSVSVDADRSVIPQGPYTAVARLPALGLEEEAVRRGKREAEREAAYRLVQRLVSGGGGAAAGGGGGEDGG